MIHKIMLKQMIGPRRWYLSPAQPVVYMTIAANAYGGATRHCEAPTEKPMFSVRMIGKKYARAYVTVVVLKKIYDCKFLCQYYCHHCLP
jgi:hypothetical protein